LTCWWVIRYTWMESWHVEWP